MPDANQLTEMVKNGDYARANNPNGVSFVAMTDDEDTARGIGRMLAQRLVPKRRWGDVLHVEPIELADDEWVYEVVVEDLGPVPVTTKAAFRR